MKAASQAKLNIGDSEHASLVSSEVVDWIRNGGGYPPAWSVEI
jgi:hypothetical protein